MSIYLILATVVIALWFFSSARSATNKQPAAGGLDEAEPWLRAEGVTASSLRFGRYDEPCLVKNSGAYIIVGRGDNADGERVDFILEVVPGSGVVDSSYLEPCAIACSHRAASREATIRGAHLCDVMAEIAIRYQQAIRI